MPSFVYQARDSRGERTSGSREAASQQEALAALRGAGLFVTKLVAADSKEAREMFPEGLPAVAAPVPANGKASAVAAPPAETLPSKKWELRPIPQNGSAAEMETPAK